jgi:cytochrome c-type biogenesis protein CcmH
MALFWVIAIAFSVAAAAFLIIPLWFENRTSGRKTFSAQIAGIAVLPVSVGVYFLVTTFDADAPATRTGSSSIAASQEEMALLDQLAARLSSDPSDVDGWVLLGRSYIQLGDYGRARLALEEAWNRTPEPDDLLKIAYAQSMLFTEEGASLGLAGDLVEDVLQRSPRDQAALLWGGFVAAERNQPAAAAERWSALLAMNPPPEIADVLRSQLLALTGSAAPGQASAAATAAEEVGPVIEVEVSVAESIALDAYGPSARLFVLARWSDMPAPIAVEQHPLSALPGRFQLSDADEMLPGRVLSQYEMVNVVARISGSGQATEQSGDAYAEATVDPRSGETLSLVIDQLVP